MARLSSVIWIENFANPSHQVGLGWWVAFIVLISTSVKKMVSVKIVLLKVSGLFQA